MFRYESPVQARRRALMLVDVLVERHGAGRLKRRWIFLALSLTFGYRYYVLPVLTSWGSRHWEQRGCKRVRSHRRRPQLSREFCRAGGGVHRLPVHASLFSALDGGEATDSEQHL
eukprot:Skav209855  [mRNA]  locus=scaffold1684:91897:97044:+ [translate_table: standard]